MVTDMMGIEYSSIDEMTTAYGVTPIFYNDMKLQGYSQEYCLGVNKVKGNTCLDILGELFGSKCGNALLDLIASVTKVSLADGETGCLGAYKFTDGFKVGNAIIDQYGVIHKDISYLRKFYSIYGINIEEKFKTNSISDTIEKYQRKYYYGIRGEYYPNVRELAISYSASIADIEKAQEENNTYLDVLTKALKDRGNQPIKPYFDYAGRVFDNEATLLNYYNIYDLPDGTNPHSSLLKAKDKVAPFFTSDTKEKGCCFNTLADACTFYRVDPAKVNEDNITGLAKSQIFTSNSNYKLNPVELFKGVL